MIKREKVDVTLQKYERDRVIDFFILSLLLLGSFLYIDHRMNKLEYFKETVKSNNHKLQQLSYFLTNSGKLENKCKRVAKNQFKLKDPNVRVDINNVSDLKMHCHINEHILSEETVNSFNRLNEYLHK